MASSHQHRSSNTLKQSNKKHKSTTTSKRSTKQKQGGKISNVGNHKKVLSIKHKIGAITKRGGNEKGSKKVRRLLQKQKLKLMNEHRHQTSFGDGSRIPSIISVINLSSRNDLSVEGIVSDKIKSISDNNKDSVYYYPNIKHGIRIYTSKSSSINTNNDLISILDQCRISNHILFVISTNDDMLSSSAIDDRASYISNDGEIILSGIKAQGLPLSNLHVLFINNNSNSANKRKKYIQRVMNAEFPSSNIRVYNDNNTQSSVNDYRMLIRSVSNCHNDSISKFVGSVPRSYIVSEGGWEYDTSNKELHIKGYIRNAPLNPKHLLHVANIGSCAIQKVCDDQQTILYKNDEDDVVVPNGIEFANPDALEGEQNLVGFDETHHIDDDDEEEEINDGEPKQASDYFSPWFDMIDSKQELDDHKSLINAFNTPSGASDTMVDEDDENNYNHRKQYQQEDKQFPDEVDIQPTELARDRLARYRSLKSFRNSYIDPKENLPEDYSRIFHFQNFKGTRKDVLNDVIDEINDCVGVDDDDDDEDVEMKDDGDTSPTYIPVGTLIIITVSVNTTSTNLLQQLSTTTTESKPLLSATTLLPHENKVSVLHMSLSPIPISTNTDKPPIIKSKDVVTIRCGWRTFQAKPIFSQHNLNCDKHKLERFMPNQGFCSMTVYGPVTYTPCPILLFQNNTLVASGNLTDIDADRIIIKRCVITGYPTRVNKRWATVKYMFYNPDDVKWFKPAGLMTKHGLQGNIMESIGEHGSMKCLFNQPIKQHDTVCLPLYKRMYPKFAPAVCSSGDDMDDTVTQKTRKLDLVVW